VTTVAVVLCWNDADRVLRLLAALAALEPAPDRIVVVDNGSTSGDADRIEAAFPAHDVARLASNRGFAAAANHGIELALALGASEVWLLNSDIELPRDALACLRRELAATPRAGMSGAVLTTREREVECFGGGRVSLWNGSCRHALRAGDRIDYLAAACLLLRADMLRETGAFDEGYFFYWEDVELGFRAREKGWTLRVATDCRVVHDEGSTLGRWSSARWELLFVGMMRFLRARAPLPAVATAARLAVHTVTMAKHGRLEAIAGAWRALVPRRQGADTPSVIFSANQTTRSSDSPAIAVKNR
jgi:GT2 family glycosyltransferase